MKGLSPTGLLERKRSDSILMANSQIESAFFSIGDLVGGQCGSASQLHGYQSLGVSPGGHRREREPPEAMGWEQHSNTSLYC